MNNDIKELTANVFKNFNDEWALLTCGTIDNHNSMTIAWGEMGTLWHRNVITVYVKPIRYTYSFMEKNDYFVVSFFDDKYKDALRIMGSNSGRNDNKDELSKLTPIKHGEVTIYNEAKQIFICKKIYYNDLDIDKIPLEERNRYYKTETPHRMYVGEVVEIINN